ncbi:MAG: S-layer homology domain-containing protein [Clostridia bacterium]|nr:S-layer homology domain-containing protein [Clostridia bacterium]
MNDEILLSLNANMLPKMASNDESMVITWINNDMNDIFGIVGTNRIYGSYLVNGNVSYQEMILETNAKVLDYDVMYYGGRLLVVYLSDEDGSYFTDEDRSLYLANLDGSTTKLAEGKLIDHPTLVEMNYEPSLFWYQDGNIKYLPNLFNPEIYDLMDLEEGERLTNQFEILQNDTDTALVYEVGDVLETGVEENPTKVIGELYYVTYNNDTKSFDGYKSNLSKNQEKISHANGILLDDGKVLEAITEEIVFEVDGEKEYAAHMKLLEVQPGIDLEIENQEILVDESSVFGGFESTMTLYIKNSGECYTEGIQLDLMDVNDQIIDTQIVDYETFIPEKDYKPVFFNYDVPSPLEEHTLKVKVTPLSGNDVDESNNIASVVLGGIDLNINDLSLRENNGLYIINTGITNMTFRQGSNVVINIYETDADFNAVGDPVKTVSLGNIEAYDQVGSELIWDTSGLDYGGQDKKVYALVVSGDEYENKVWNNVAYITLLNEQARVLPFDVQVTEVVPIETGIQYNVMIQNNYNAENTAEVTLNGYDLDRNIIYTDVKSILLAKEEIAYLPFEINDAAVYDAIDIIYVSCTDSAQGGMTLDGVEYYSNIAIETTVDLTLSSNANLAALSFDNLAYDFELSGDTTFIYNHDSEESFELTAISEDQAALISYILPDQDPVYLASGEASEAFDMLSGDIEIIIEAEDGTEASYMITISSSSSNSTPSGGTSSTQPEVTDGTTTVLIDGIAVDAGDEDTEEREDGSTETTVTLNPSVIEAQIDEEVPKDQEREVIVTIQNTDSDKQSVLLTGNIVKMLEEKSYDIQIQAGNVVYDIPAEEINISKVTEELGLNVDQMKDIEISIVIEKQNQEEVEAINAKALEQGIEVASEILSFEVVARTVSLDGETHEINVTKFNRFVKRRIILEDYDAGSVTTGVVADGETFSPIPTRFYLENNIWYAEMNSMTNSNYLLIKHNLNVDSVLNHWSENMVNQFASNLIIDNPEVFEPDESISRRDFTKYIVKAIGLYREINASDNKFTDVMSEDLPATNVAYEYNIISGYPDGSFKPDALISREEAMVISANVMSVIGLNDFDRSRMETFDDFDSISSWAKALVAPAVGAHIFNGIGDNLLAPHEKITYAEAVAAIYNLLVSAKIINN